MPHSSMLVRGSGELLRREEDGGRVLTRAGLGEALDVDPAELWSARTAEMAVRREVLTRLARRSERAARMSAFGRQLLAADTEAELCEVVARHAGEMVGVYTAFVLLREGGRVWESGGVRLAGAWSVVPSAPQREMALRRLPREPGLTASLELWGSGGAGGEVSLVAHVPFGPYGALVLTERRSERIFDRDDWEVLAAVAAQGTAALRRLRELELARTEALHDALTGLANRRKMEVVLEHAWAAAERGDDLAVLMMDLDDFKGVNDRLGHAAGDDLLRVVGEVLRREVRRADTAVRYGGDEFLVILPRGGLPGARLLAERLRHALAGWVELSWGAAAYSPRHGSPEALLAEADAACGTMKRGR
jgi:diguanylate cyclase (GGDEF)-like protein